MKQGDHEAITEVERATWNRSAATYLENAAELTKHAIPWLLDACALTKDSHAIDVACGPGHLTNMMSKSGAHVVGVDLSSAMIELAKRLYPGLTFYEARVEALPFENDSFDIALINFAIHHFARPEIACAEIRRVIKRGGRLVFAGPLEQFGFGAFIEGITAHHTLDDLPHGPIYLDADCGTYEKLMEDSGFNECDVQAQQLTLHLDTLDPLLVAGWDICELGTLPADTQEKIRSTTTEKAQPYRTKSGYEFPDTVVTGIAIKR